MTPRTERERGGDQCLDRRRDGTLRTRHADHGILRSITRTTLVDVVAAAEIDVEERAFSVEECLARASFHHGGDKHLFSGGRG